MKSNAPVITVVHEFSSTVNTSGAFWRVVHNSLCPMLASFHDK